MVHDEVSKWLDQPEVAKARAVCELAHDGQQRDDGTPYATHPHAVANILLDYGYTNARLLAAAYLHDVLEDTDVSRQELVREFGIDVVRIVDQLTNVGPRGRSFEEKHAQLQQHARQMTGEAKLIKLADRLSNLRDMHVWPEHKRNRYAVATRSLLLALQPVPCRELANEVERLSSLT